MCGGTISSLPSHLILKENREILDKWSFLPQEFERGKLRSIIQHPIRDGYDIDWDEWLKKPAITDIYDFDAQEIENLKNMCYEVYKKTALFSSNVILPPKCGYLSTNDVLLAFIWCCIRGARQMCNSPLR
jgi:hypothetical protein